MRRSWLRLATRLAVGPSPDNRLAIAAELKKNLIDDAMKGRESITGHVLVQPHGDCPTRRSRPIARAPHLV